MKRLALGLLTALLSGSGLALAAPQPGWHDAFAGPTPALHLQGHFFDAGGQAHPLEFWRDAGGRVVRRTDARAELRLTPAAAGEDAYQLLNLQTRRAYDVHRSNLFRLGIFTDRWSVQHLLDAPREPFTLTDEQREERTPAGRCRWWRVKLASGAASEACWSSALGVPLLLRSGGRTTFRASAVSTAQVRLPDPALPAGWQEFNADEDLSPD